MTSTESQYNKSLKCRDSSKSSGIRECRAARSEDVKSENETFVWLR